MWYATIGQCLNCCSPLIKEDRKILNDKIVIKCNLCGKVNSFPKVKSDDQREKEE